MNKMLVLAATLLAMPSLTMAMDAMHEEAADIEAMHSEDMGMMMADQEGQAPEVDMNMVDDMKTMAAKQAMRELMKYALIVVASVPVLMIYPFVQKYFVRGIMLGSIKG